MRVSVLSIFLAVVTSQALADSPPQSRQLTYTCTDSGGQRRNSDRPIPECGDREQRVLNRDGSLKRIVPPTPTADERARREASMCHGQEANVRPPTDVVRGDRVLVLRFPNEAAHNRARDGSLESVRMAMRATEERIKELESERALLTREAESSRGGEMPAQLKQQIEANETSMIAQRKLIQTQDAELMRIDRQYDKQLKRLRKLWRGAPPGWTEPINDALPTLYAPLPRGIDDGILRWPCRG